MNEAAFELMAHSAEERRLAYETVERAAPGAPPDPSAWPRLALARDLAQQASCEADPFGFSLSRLMLAQATNAPIPAFERVVIERASERAQQAFSRSRAWLPWGGLAHQRTMTVASGAKGGYLVGIENMEPADALRGESVTQALGVQFISGLQGGVTLPVVKSDPSVAAVAEGVAPSSQSDPVFGQASGTPRTIIATVPVSRQLVQQGPSVDAFISQLLRRAISAQIDRHVLAGAGGAEPLGVFNMPDISTVPGTSLAHAGVLSMRRKCIDGGATESSLRWIGNGATQELLGAREKAIGSGAFLWEDGRILGRQAIATKLAPGAALAVGDWSTVRVLLWGPGIRVDVDPSALWNSGGLVLRVMAFVDLIYTHPTALCVATSIT
ncbi:MAG: phage major capsid protein [Rubrivivax sp.]